MLWGVFFLFLCQRGENACVPPFVQRVKVSRGALPLHPSCGAWGQT